MRVHEETTEKKGAGKPYERTQAGKRTRRDPPPKHNFRVELKELIAISNIAARLKVPAKTDREMGPNKNAWCEFHQANGHYICNCLVLAHQLDEMVKSRFLKDYLQEPQNDQALVTAGVDQGHEVPIHGEVNTISGGFLGGGCTASQRKKYTWEVMAVEVQQVDQTPVVDLLFTKADLQDVIPHDNDPVVISLVTAGRTVHRVLVDQGSSADVMFWTTFNKLQLSTDQLRPYTECLYGFAGDQVEVCGHIELRTTLTDGTTSRTTNIKYVVVNAALAYNILLGRPTLNRIGAVASTRHMKMKLPSLEGVVITIKSDQKEAKKCYENSLKTKRGVFAVTTQPPREEGITRAEIAWEKQPEPVGDIVEREIGGKMFKLGQSLSQELQDQVAKVIARHLDAFVWSASDMHNIDPDFLCHRLTMDPQVRPVRQRRRKFNEERRQVVREEMKKLLKACHIREILYPEWLANVVLVKKANEKWRMCVDFTDLNKACLKDSYPLLSIDALVDSTSGCRLFSFLDAFSSYNQIMMHLRDECKTTFMTELSCYCYKVMPFGLKNACATYQRLVDKVLVPMLGRNVQAYVDDMVVTSQQKKQHVADLEELFTTIAKYRLNLNPEKCVFGVEVGKFLGFLLTEQGIEANPEMYVAIIAMKSPISVKEV